MDIKPHQELSPTFLSAMIKIKGAAEGYSYFFDLFERKLNLTVRKTLKASSCADPPAHAEDIKQLVLLAVRSEFDKLQAGTREEFIDPAAYFFEAARHYCHVHLKACRRASTGDASGQAGTVEDEIGDLAFFLPDKRTTDTIWFLSEKIAEGFQDESDRALCTDEYLVFFQKFVAEKIYDHFAMLSERRDGEEISLLRVFTEDLAPVLGFGRYIEKKIPENLLFECYGALYDLAEEFETWFIEEKGGVFWAMFGRMCSLVYCAKNRDEVAGYEDLLVLEADVDQENKIENDIARKLMHTQAAGGAA